MKPTRNRVFCLAYGHHKMLFDNEQAANNFIKYNHDEILEENGKAPTRAYYCDVCSGWHVTSMEAFDIESSYDVLEKRMSIRGQQDMLNCDGDVVKVFYEEGKYVEAYQTIINNLRRYKKQNLLFLETFRHDAITLYMPFLSDCLEHLYNQILELFNNGQYHDIFHQAKVLKTYVDELAAYTDTPATQQLQIDYLEKINKLILATREAQSERKQQAIIAQRENPALRRVLRSDALRIPELLAISQNALQTGTPYDSLMIAYDMFDLYAQCKARNYVDEEDDLNSKVYTHIIDIVMHLVALVDEHIHSRASMQAEIELDEFLSFFTEKFSKYEDDPKMAQIYNSVKSLLEQKQESITF